MRQSRTAARRMVRTVVRPSFRAPLPPAAHRVLADLASAGAALPPDVVRDPGLLGARPSEVHTPAAPSGRVVLHLHGGAFVLGGRRTHRAFASWLAAESGATVHVLDYRLAPAHPFPAALDDARAAWDDLVRRTGDPAAVVVTGDSAGGWLALALALSLRDRGVGLPAALGLVSPWVDLSLPAGPDWDADALLSREWLARSAASYLGGTDPHDPRVDLTTADLTGLPRTVVQVGDEEALRADAERLHERLAAAGVDADLEVLSGLWHVAHLMAGSVDEATAAVRSLAAQLRGP